MISGVITSIVIIILSRILSKYLSTAYLTSTLLISIAFIYVGFALKDNPVSSIVLEVFVALIFYSIAIFGYAQNNYFIAYGIILHGVWDIFHHRALITTDLPGYWPSFCIVVDVIDGIYFWFVFRKEKNAKLNAPENVKAL